MHSTRGMQSFEVTVMAVYELAVSRERDHGKQS